MTITLSEALRRILTSDAIGEGPDAECMPGVVLEAFQLRGAAPCHVRDVVAFLAAAGPEGVVRHYGIELRANMPVRVERRLRNWIIRSEANGDALLKVHPWDDRANVARLQATSPVDLSGLNELADELERIANKAERIRQFVIAENLWGMVSVIRQRVRGNAEGALREAARLRALIAQLTTPTPS